MKTEEIFELFQQFESIANEYAGVECWSARELSVLLGYAKWEKFSNVIEKAKEACVKAGENPDNHFPHVGKMVTLGSSALREVNDFMLTRYACYLIAQKEYISSLRRKHTNPSPQTFVLTKARDYYCLKRGIDKDHFSCASP